MILTNLLDIALIGLLLLCGYYAQNLSKALKSTNKRLWNQEQSLVASDKPVEVTILVETRPEKWVFGDPESPIISLKPILTSKRVDSNFSSSPLPIEFQKEVALPQAAINRLQALLKSVPDLIQSGSNVYRVEVTFSAETMLGLQTGLLELTQASGSHWIPVARNVASNRFVEIAQIGRHFNPVATTTVVWQVMAAITAQKFLAVIDNRLHGLENGVKEIISWLHTEQMGELMANYSYLQEISPILEAGQCSQVDIVSYNTLLDQIGLSSSSVINASKLRFEPTVSTLRQAHEQKKQVTREENADILDKITNYSRDMVSAIYILLWATRLKALLPVNPDVVNKRLVAIDQKINDLYSDLDETFELLDESIPQLSRLTRMKKGRGANERFTAEIQQERSTVESQAYEAANKLLAGFSKITEDMRTIIEGANQQTSFVVEIDPEFRILSAKSLSIV